MKRDEEEDVGDEDRQPARQGAPADPARSIRSTSGLSARARKIAAQSQRIVVLISTITWLSSTATPIATMTIATTLNTARDSMRDGVHRVPPARFSAGANLPRRVRYPALTG